MNQFFSFQRFALLVAKHWADNKKRYILSVLAFMGVLIAWFIFMMLTEVDAPLSAEVQRMTYFFALFTLGSFYASQYFRDLGTRSKGINFLMVPASAFEKILCSLLFTFILFFIVFTAVFYAVDALMVTVANSIYGGREGAVAAPVSNVFDLVVLKFNDDTTVNLLCFYFSVQSAFLLGSIYFEKYSFIKTVISGFIACFLLFCVLIFFSEKLLPDGDYLMGFLTTYRVYVDGVNDRIVQVPSWIGELLRFMLIYGAAPFLWLVTYFRLKEKQV